MEQIEKIFYDWTDDQTDSCELRAMYVKLEDELTKQIGKEKYSKFEDLIMDCILCERLEAFKAVLNKQQPFGRNVFRQRR